MKTNSTGIMRTLQNIIALLVCLIGSFASAMAQPPKPTEPQWNYVKDDDLLHAEVYDRFVLEGVYLKPPRLTTKTPPAIVIECSKGKVKQNYFNVGAVVVPGPDHTKLMFLEGRIDGKKTVFLTTGLSTDGQGVFFPRYDLTTILKGKEVIVGAYEYLGAQVVMSFEIPNPSPVLEKCGSDRVLKRQMK